MQANARRPHSPPINRLYDCREQTEGKMDGATGMTVKIFFFLNLCEIKKKTFLTNLKKAQITCMKNTVYQL